jgi:hypothetical protein
MDNKKFEQLIDLIINENEEQARALFHDIVVEKSREIYEHLMDEDTLEENLMVEPTDSSEPPVNASGQAAGLLDEIEMEEQGMNEEDDEMDLDDMDDEDTEIMDLDSDEEDLDGMDDEGSVEDRVVDIEDKVDNLERLMAEFEEIMNGGGGDEESLDDMDDEAGAFAGGDDMDNPEGDEMMEAITLKPVKGLYGSNIGGDNGQQTKSTVRFNSGQNGMASKPFALGGKSESVPTSPKGPSNYGSKGETQVKGAGSFKNVPAQAKQDLTAAPKPTTTQAAGVNTKSPLAESRRTVRKTTR